MTRKCGPDDDNKDEGFVNNIINKSTVSFKRAINELIGGLTEKCKYVHKPVTISIPKEMSYKLSSIKFRIVSGFPLFNWSFRSVFIFKTKFSSAKE